MGENTKYFFKWNGITEWFLPRFSKKRHYLQAWCPPGRAFKTDTEDTSSLSQFRHRRQLVGYGQVQWLRCVILHLLSRDIWTTKRRGYQNNWSHISTTCRDSSVGIATTGWTVRGSNPGGGEIFRTRPDRTWGPPSLLYNGYGVITGDKAAGAWR